MNAETLVSKFYLFLFLFYLPFVIIKCWNSIELTILNASAKMDVSQIVFHKQGSKKSRQAEPDGIADALTTSTTESSSGYKKNWKILMHFLRNSAIQN